MSDKKVTIRELQTFIEAVEFAADTDNWVPSERQWKRIRSMIDALEAEPERPAVQPAAPMMYNAPLLEQPRPAYDGPVIMQPSNMPAPVHRATPASTAFTNNGMTGKTPDLDTSSGSYTSQFA